MVSLVSVVVLLLPNGLRLRVGKGSLRLVVWFTLDSVVVTLGLVGKGNRLLVLLFTLSVVVELSELSEGSVETTDFSVVLILTSLAGTNPLGLLICKTSKSRVAPFLFLASMVSLGSESVSVLSNSILVGFSSAKISMNFQPLEMYFSNCLPAGSSSVGLTIFTTSKILVDPSLLTAEIVTVSGAKVTGSGVGRSLFNAGFSDAIWNLVNGIRAKLDTPGLAKGLSSPICSKILDVVLISVIKNQRLFLARKFKN